MSATREQLQELMVALKQAIPSFQERPAKQATVDALYELEREPPMPDLAELVAFISKVGSLIEEGGQAEYRRKSYTEKLLGIIDPLRSDLIKYIQSLQKYQALSEQKQRIDTQKTQKAQVIINKTREQFLTAATQVAAALSMQTRDSGSEYEAGEGAKMERSTGYQLPSVTDLQADQRDLDTLQKQSAAIEDEKTKAADALTVSTQHLDKDLIRCKDTLQTLLTELEGDRRAAQDRAVSIKSVASDISQFTSDLSASGGNINKPKRSYRRKPDHAEILEQAYILDSLQETRTKLKDQRQERLNQAHASAITALVLLSIGTLLIFAGVICVYTINLTAGVITVVASAVTNVVGAVALRYNKQTNDRLDSASGELLNLERATMAMHLISYISDVEKRDKAIADLIQQLYALPSKPVAPVVETQPRE